MTGAANLGVVLLLVIDTSTPAVTVAVAEASDGGEEAVLAQRVTVDPRRHAELLAPSLEAVLAEATATPGDLDAVVAGVGPGPYTWLRVGLMTAAALADALGLPTYGVCSLDAIACAAPRRPGSLLVATDARRREVYWATYDPGRVRLTGPAVNRPHDVDTAGCTAAGGAGAEQYADVFGLPVTEPAYPPASGLAALAAARATGRTPSEPLTPMYLRRPDAAEPAAGKTVLR